MPLKRRVILLSTLTVTLGSGLTGTARADAGSADALQDGDADARSIEYVSDASHVERSRYPKYAPGQSCRNCSLFIADGNSPLGACGLVFGKLVAAAGWCVSWAVPA